MKKIYAASILILLFTISCKEDHYKDIPFDKPHWDASDYENTAQSIIFGTPEGEQFPGINNRPEIFNRIIDKENINGVLEDNSLGLKFRNEFAESVFKVSRDLLSAYSSLDRQDKFIYPSELIKLREWGFFVQLKYFKLGNEEILKDVVNPEDNSVKSVIHSNEQTLIDNFEYGIEFANKEDALTEETVTEYAKVIDDYYTQLLQYYPDGDYTPMLETTVNVSKKIKSAALKKSLDKLKMLIEANSNVKISIKAKTDGNQ